MDSRNLDYGSDDECESLENWNGGRGHSIFYYRKVAVKGDDLLK